MFDQTLEGGGGGGIERSPGPHAQASLSGHAYFYEAAPEGPLHPPPIISLLQNTQSSVCTLPPTQSEAFMN